MKMTLAVMMVIMAAFLVPGCSAQADLSDCTALVAELSVETEDLQARVAALEGAQAALRIELSEREATVAALQKERDTANDELSAAEAGIVELEEEVEFLRLPPPDKVDGEIAGYVSQEEVVEECRKYVVGTYSVGGRTRGPYALATLATLEAFLEKDHTESFPPLQLRNKDMAAFLLKSSWDRSNLPGHSLGFLLIEETNPMYGLRETWQNIFLTEEDGQIIFYEVDPRNDKVTIIKEPSEKYRQVHILGSGYFSS